MACNFLTPRAMDVKAASDTLSEISETGTTTSGWNSEWDSREDLRDFVIKQGMQDVSDLYQDRFRVDRKKLEHMLIGDNEAPEPADTFFHKIMEDTNTYITWPSKLKIGAKSKRDPHVRIAGKPEDVQVAKERIMNVLNTRCNRVTMKIDVSYTDHSHIIGKGGQSIKRVMEETRCHVHFPDSNRSNPVEKSNQVSIAGDIEGVERARSRVRNLTPLIFSFELPILSPNHPVPDNNTPYVIKVQEQFNVQVMFRTRPKLHATLVMVKGVEWEVQHVKQATMLLVEYMCENLANQISIQMSMEISPHHHSLVIGRNHCNLKNIIQNTNTQIMFPDAQDPNIPSLKKSNVTISGHIHNVYFARQQLMGSLPLVLMFDLPEDTSNLPIGTEQIAKIQSALDINITIRHKAKQNTMACIIKGIERYASNVYEARNRILNLKEPAIVADIPTTYLLVPSALTIDVPPTINVQPISPTVSPLASPTWQPLPTLYKQAAPCMSMLQQSYNTYNNMMHGSLGSSGFHSLGQFSSSSLSLEHSHEGNSYSSIASASPISSPRSSPRNSVSPVYLKSSTESPNSDKLELSSILSQSSEAGVSGSGNYQESLFAKRIDNRQTLAPPDYEQKRIAGIRAMQSRPTGGFRVPTNIWSGYGLSYTSPSSIQMDQFSNANKEEDVWKTPASNQADFNFPSAFGLNTSSYVDHTPTNIINRITTSKWPDLASLLSSIGLEKYIGLFASHEIDLHTFPSLTEEDLLELGVKAFGARRKMLLTISELNKRSSPFSAAPGAERKSSSSTLSNHSSPRDW